MKEGTLVSDRKNKQNRVMPVSPGLCLLYLVISMSL